MVVNLISDRILHVGNESKDEYDEWWEVDCFLFTESISMSSTAVLSLKKIYGKVCGELWTSTCILRAMSRGASWEFCPKCFRMSILIQPIIYSFFKT